MEVIHIDNVTQDEWVYNAFIDAYAAQRTDSIMKMFTIVDSDDPVDIDTTSIICVRLFIEGGQNIVAGQKYIAGLRFYSFGDMATLDIISLDKPYHREIAIAHAKKMNWISLDVHKDLFSKSHAIPLMVVGGHLSVFSEDVELAWHSQDYGGNLLGCDVNALMRHIMSLCGLSDVGDPTGKSMITDLLTLMKMYRGKHDFYDRLAQIKFGGTGQHYGAMLMMKVCDRMIAEGKDDQLQIIVDEISSGFAQKHVIGAFIQKAML